MVKNPFGGGFCRRRRFLPTLPSRRLFAGVRAHARVVVVCVENDDDDAFPRSNFECVFLRPIVAGRRTLTTTKDDDDEIDDDSERVRREEDDGNAKRIIPTTLFYTREEAKRTRRNDDDF